ncbi:Dihydroneopterin aldolase [Jannaschia seosinensis]|uniref:dihydroneopterin aldolase n=1 Tax=Jannaschia seosinensis TaxID=313367 RepID=A0A0M7BI83_9RHOB|nr:dihydroneopterin aldolase [Jannaschia seosinensis]CUH41085.1 Dihydroneopterin aldolase [Jannaschia seosinensis]
MLPKHAATDSTSPDQEALRLAFAAPLDRARASGLPLDRISLREHVREVEIGAFQAERGVTQRIRFDIVAEVSPDEAGAAMDDVDDILSYDTLTDAIEVELAAERINLLETLAERIAARILRNERAARVFVRIEKLDRGPHILGVEIVRSRIATSPPTSDDAPQPLVVLLPPGAQEDPDLGALLDRLASRAEPAVLIATPDFDAPQAAHPLAQRRIDLLALEQAAWRLAARDARCIVVDSRTELDWSMRRGGLTVWAPSRIVLDATDGPAGTAPLIIARWFAETFRAVELVTPHQASSDKVPERHAARLSDI